MIQENIVDFTAARPPAIVHEILMVLSPTMGLPLNRIRMTQEDIIDLLRAIGKGKGTKIHVMKEVRTVGATTTIVSDRHGDQ